MFIHDPPKSQTRKELKVNVPVRLHLRLQAIHAAEGREAPKVVAEALNLYFAKLAAEGSGPR